MTAAPLYYDKDTVCEVTSLSAFTVEDLVRKNDFPRPRQLSGKRVGWLAREVEAWAESRPIADQPPPPNTGVKRARAASAPAPRA